MENSKQIKNINLISLVSFAIITIVLWQIPNGKLILYPFTILGTWFHEMGHGLTAILLGGNFIRLELFPDGSGLAVHSTSMYLSNFGHAIIAAAGPLGPTIVGSIFIIISKNEKLSKYILLFLVIIIIVSIVLWLRPIISLGTGIMLAFAVVILLITLLFNNKIQQLTLQFLGIQAYTSVYLSIDYLFSSGASLAGQDYYSDTAVIAKYLFLPYWFWGAFIILISIFLLYLSLRFVFKTKESKKI